MRRRDRRLTMADDKDIVVEFLNSKSGSKSKFYFKDFLDLFPDKGPRDVKKILTKLVNEEVLEFWEGIRDRADRIDFAKLLEEKLGYELPVSYEDWIHYNHYEKIRPADTKWLYRQEQGYVESMKNITLKELAEQRIGEFTDALRKYIL